MKKFIGSIAITTLLSFFVSCSNNDIGSGNENNGSLVANGKVYWQGNENRQYTRGDLAVYMIIKLSPIEVEFIENSNKQLGEYAIKEGIIYNEYPISSSKEEYPFNLVDIEIMIENVRNTININCYDIEKGSIDESCVYIVTWYAQQPPGEKDEEGSFTNAVNEGRAFYILYRYKEMLSQKMLESGTMSNGELSLDLPKNVDSRFLTEFEPLGVGVWFYTDPLRLIDNNGNHIGNLRYYKKIGNTEHFVHYWYFSENVKFNDIVEYKIDAKKGWNKVYSRVKQSGESYFTTDLSEVPDGLKWLVEEFAE